MAVKVPQPKASHKVKKGETIEKIGKQYGFAKVDDIWKYPKNKNLVKLRKNAKDVQPGDIVVIPAYNDKERKEIAEKRPGLRQAAGAAKYSASKLKDHAAVDRALADKLDAMAASHKATADKLITEYKKAANKGKQWSDGVDFANMLIGIVGGLRALAQKSMKASVKMASECKKQAAEAAKLVNEMIVDTTVARWAPITSQMTKRTGKYLTDTSTGPKSDVLLFAGELIESFGKMTSPSFYGQGVALLWEGKSLKKAATFDLGADLKESVKKLTAERDRIVKLANEKAKAARNRAKKAETDAVALLKQSKDLNAEADTL